MAEAEAAAAGTEDGTKDGTEDGTEDASMVGMRLEALKRSRKAQGKRRCGQNVRTRDLVEEQGFTVQVLVVEERLVSESVVGGHTRMVPGRCSFCSPPPGAAVAPSRPRQAHAARARTRTRAPQAVVVSSR